MPTMDFCLLKTTFAASSATAVRNAEMERAGTMNLAETIAVRNTRFQPCLERREGWNEALIQSTAVNGKDAQRPA